MHLFISTLAKMFILVFLSCLVTKPTQKKTSNEKLKQRKLHRNSLPNGLVPVCIPKLTINRNRKVHVLMHLQMFPHWTLVPLVYHLCYLLFSASGTRFSSCFSAKTKFIRKQMCHIINNDKSTYFFLLLMMFILRVRGRIT